MIVMINEQLMGEDGRLANLKNQTCKSNGKQHRFTLEDKDETEDCQTITPNTSFSACLRSNHQNTADGNADNCDSNNQYEYNDQERMEEDSFKNLEVSYKVRMGERLTDDIIDVYCDKLQKSINNEVDGMLAMQYISLNESVREQILIMFAHLYDDDELIEVAVETGLSTQNDSWSCGLRAVAFITHLVFGINPTRYEYDLEKVRKFIMDIIKMDRPSRELLANAQFGHEREGSKSCLAIAYIAKTGYFVVENEAFSPKLKSSDLPRRKTENEYSQTFDHNNDKLQSSHGSNLTNRSGDDQTGFYNSKPNEKKALIRSNNSEVRSNFAASAWVRESSRSPNSYKEESSPLLNSNPYSSKQMPHKWQ
ncbi:unnamed protein product [Thelazia callipaeda]|uniref:ULP_PROTEASE domain-containing protein n=1 Tax=Thelazia callipaeda TaxID=103827 RepID=A0A0N5CZF2_THECL|nr:unnamed protein product [Thelazia callipaeda]